jgi:hypothetical protein
MGVYKEAEHAIKLITQRSVQIYPDACDFGALCNKGDEIWNWGKQLVDWYQDKKKPIVREHYGTGQSCSAVVIVGSDNSERDITKKYKVEYVGVKKRINYNGKKYDGYFHVYEVK